MGLSLNNPFVLTYNKIIAALGFVPGVSSTTAVFTDLVTDSIAGDNLVIDGNGYLIGSDNVLAPAQSYFFNSTSKAAILKSYLENTIIHVPFWGQSLAKYGGTYTPVTINTTQSRTGKVIIPDVGMFPYGQPWFAVKDAVDEYYTSGDVNQGSTSAGAAFTYMVGFGNRLYDLIYAAFGVGPTILLTVDALEGQSIQDLGPGSNTGEYLLQNMVYAKAYAKSVGKAIDMPFARCEQGNADFLSMSGWQHMLWYIQLQKMLTRARGDIYGNPYDVLLYVKQVASARTSIGDVSEITKVQYELPEKLPHQFRLISPDDDLIHEDGTHMNSANYDIRDARDAEFVFKDQYAGGIPPFKTYRAWWTSSTVAQFEVAVKDGPIVLDYTYNSAVVTADAATDVFTWTGSNLVNGTQIMFTNSGGALPSGISAGVRYFTVSGTANTFKVSATSGGAAIDITTNGTGTHTAYAGGFGIQFDDDSGAPPYVSALSIVDSGVNSGTVTFDSTTDIMTWTNVVLTNNRTITFTNSGGALPSPLVAGTTYYVINGTTGSCQLSATSGGAAINLTTNGTGTTTATFSSTAPAGRAVIQVTLSAAPASYGRKRFLFGLLQGPAGTSPGAYGGARNVIRDSATGTIAHDRTNAAVTFNLYRWMAKHEVMMPS